MIHFISYDIYCIAVKMIINVGSMLLDLHEQLKAAITSNYLLFWRMFGSSNAIC